MRVDDVFWAIILLAFLLIAARIIRQRTRVFRRFFIPSSLIAGALGLLLGPQVLGTQGPPGDEGSPQVIPLPDPRLSGPSSLEEVALSRRSVRAFRPDSLGLPLVSQLLWAAQGITDDGGLRSAPSAGATFPLEVLVVTGREEGLAPGVYRYRPRSHDLQRIGVGDLRSRLARAALDQTWMTDAPVLLVLVGDFSRTTARYGDRGRRYVHMEVGHVAQDTYLQAEALELGTTVVGAFRDGEVSDLLGLPAAEEPLVILPVGVPR